MIIDKVVVNILSFFTSSLHCPPIHSSVSIQKGAERTYQVEVGLSSSPCDKARQGNPVWAISSQEPAKVLGTAPAPPARSLAFKNNANEILK